MNPDGRRTAHSYSWHFLVSSWTALWRGYFARGYLEEVNAGNANTSNWLQGGGFNQHDEIHSVNSFEAAAEGTGASAVKDGIDHGAATRNPEGDMGDMEIWELAEPLVYLGRSKKCNSAGYGKYRGGVGFESLRMVWGAKDWTMFFIGNGYMVSDWGLMGGYPSAARYRFEAHGTDMKDRIEKGLPMPWGADRDPDYEKVLKAKQIKRDKQAITTETIFEDYDLYLNYLRGGPGFGDPIERDPKKVEKDLNEEVLLPRYAKSIYGVAFEQKDGQFIVDKPKTDELRGQIRKERLQKAIPVKEWMAKERERILKKEASSQVKHMFATSFSLSSRFFKDFRNFWNLLQGWSLTEKKLDVPTFGAKHRMGMEKLPGVFSGRVHRRRLGGKKRCPTNKKRSKSWSMGRSTSTRFTRCSLPQRIRSGSGWCWRSSKGRFLGRTEFSCRSARTCSSCSVIPTSAG